MPRGRAADVLISLWPMLCIAAIVFPAARLFRYGGGGKRDAVPVAAAMVLGTALLPLGTTDFLEPMLAFLVACALERTLAARRVGGRARTTSLLLAGVFGGAAMLAKPSALVLLPVLALPIPFGRRDVRLVRDGAAFLLGALPFCALLLWLDHVRFGSPFELGYSGQLGNPLTVRAPMGWTLLRLLFLPNRGLIWFAPILLLTVLGLRGKAAGLARRVDRVTAAGIFAVLFGTVALWWGWEGGMTWGPRLLAPAIAVAAPLLWSPSRWFRPSVVVLAAAGFLLNLPGLLLEWPRIYWVAMARPEPLSPLGPVVPIHFDAAKGVLQGPQRVHYVPSCAPAFVGYRILATLATNGDGPAAGNPDGLAPDDSILLRFATGRPIVESTTSFGRFLFEEARRTSAVDPGAAFDLATRAPDWGGPVEESRMLSARLGGRSRGEGASR
jgi:hypothetical protein